MRGLTLSIGMVLLATACGGSAQTDTTSSAPSVPATETTLPATETTLADTGPPAPPGTRSDLDPLWVECGEDGDSWQWACDMLARSQAYPYSLFAQSCGGRFEYYLTGSGRNCNVQLMYREEAPPGGLAVIPWGDHAIKTVCVVADETYEDVEPGFTPVSNRLLDQLHRPPFYLFPIEVGKETLSFTGPEIELYTWGYSDCDTTLTIETYGHSHTATYLGLGTQHPGAAVSGTMTLTQAGWPPLSFTLDGNLSPPLELTTYSSNAPYPTPSSAPYWRAIRDQVDAAFADWFGPSFAGQFSGIP